MRGLSRQKRERIIRRDGGACRYCPKQGIIGYLEQEGAKCLTAWEVIDRPTFIFEPHRLRNPNGDGWIVPFHIDHIVPKAAGGTDDAANLALACRHCHCTKTGRERYKTKAALEPIPELLRKEASRREKPCHLYLI